MVASVLEHYSVLIINFLDHNDCVDVISDCFKTNNNVESFIKDAIFNFLTFTKMIIMIMISDKVNWPISNIQFVDPLNHEGGFASFIFQVLWHFKQVISKSVI